jgi:hypothetical protein
MADKSKQNEENKQTIETWRKPLKVPPRDNAMRSFYKGDEEESSKKAEQRKPKVTPPKKNKSAKTIQKQSVRSSLKKENETNAKTETGREANISQNQNSDSESNIEKLTKEELSEQLGFEANDLFDVHELLRGKSFDIYQNLLQSCDETGRCKITQPELMDRTGIKNRRTFYKHEERLLGLKLIEKRHHPGDHKGVVYRIFRMKEVLPIPPEMLEQFEMKLKENA